MKELNYYFEYKGADILRTEDFSSLSDTVQQGLFPQLVEAAAAGFCRPVTKEFTDDVANHIQSGDLFVIMMNQRAEGLAIRKFFPGIEAVFLAGATKSTVTPSGVIEELTRRYINEKNARVVATRTQNDRVLDVLINLCDEVVPVHRIAEDRDLNLLGKLDQLSTRLINEPLIIKGCYGGPMIGTGERRRSSRPEVRSVTDRLDYMAGDALLVLGYRGEK